MLLYVLGLGSPTYPLPESAYAAWTATYRWDHCYGYDYLYAGPLFTHQLSHIWIDFRGIQDAFMRSKGIDYFENSRGAACRTDPMTARSRHGLWRPRYHSRPRLCCPHSLTYCIHDLGLTASNRYGFKATFNPTYPAASGNPHGWVSPWHVGINEGPTILMIENYNTGLLWRLMRNCPYIVGGLRRAGFDGGGYEQVDLWLS